MADSCLASFPVHFGLKNFSHHLFPYSSKPSCACRRSNPSSSLLPPHFFLFLGKEKISSFRPVEARTTRGREGGAESIAEHKYVALDGEEITEGSDFAEGDGEKLHTELLEDTKLFVGNLPYDIDSKKLALFFQKVGVVEVAEVIYKRETNQSRGFGFVSMSTVEEAERAVEQLHAYEWNGRQLTVSKASTGGGSRPESAGNEEPSFRIYVGNLPWEVDNASLEQIFSEHGRVLNRRVVYDRQTGRSRGFGFVTMASKTEVDGAIAALDGQSLEGRAIRVNVAEERLQQHQPPQIT